MKSGRRGKDVLEIFGAWFLETMERGISIVFSQTLVFLSIAGKLHCLVLGQCYTDRLPVKLLAI